MLASTLLISEAPKPVTVLLCFGLVMLGPTGPEKSPSSGADVEGRRWWAGFWVVVAEAMTLEIQVRSLDPQAAVCKSKQTTGRLWRGSGRGENQECAPCDGDLEDLVEDSSPRHSTLQAPQQHAVACKDASAATLRGNA